MKKFVIFVLILSLGMFTIVGCGSGSSAKKGTGPIQAEKDKATPTK